MTNARDYTKRYLNAMPADSYDFKPLPELRSFAQQMLHLADANYFFISMASGKPNPLGTTSAELTIEPTKEATIKAVMDSYAFLITTLNEITPDQLMDPIKFGELETQRSAVIAKAYEHQAHHRGQIAIYLRLNGVIPPEGTIF